MPTSPNFPDTVPDDLMNGRDVIVGGDLDGSMANFMTIIRMLMDHSYRMACVLGDILCDRGEDGFQILQLIDALKKRGKNIEVLIGNHDAVAFYTLIGIQAHTFHSGIHDNKRLSKKSGMFNSSTSEKTQRQFAGLNEFTIFLPENGEIGPVELISRMKGDERGRDILRYLTEMKIGTMQNNTVLFHTPPSKIILDDLQKRIGTIDNKTFPTQLARAIQQVNIEFQTAITKYLSNPLAHNQERDKIATMLHIYCHTLNSCTREDCMARIPPNMHSHEELYNNRWIQADHPILAACYQHGIHWIHGHTNTSADGEAARVVMETANHIIFTLNSTNPAGSRSAEK